MYPDGCDGGAGEQVGREHERTNAGAVLETLINSSAIIRPARASADAGDDEDDGVLDDEAKVSLPNSQR